MTAPILKKLDDAGVAYDRDKIIYGKLGDSESLSNELTRLIINGKKTATCCLKISMETDGEKIPSAGDIEIVTDWNDIPLFALKYIGVELKKFCEVTEDFAREEGEGDLSLGYWRNAHTAFFNRECARLGINFSKNLELVCLRFKVVCLF